MVPWVRWPSRDSQYWHVLQERQVILRDRGRRRSPRAHTASVPRVVRGVTWSNTTLNVRYSICPVTRPGGQEDPPLFIVARRFSVVGEPRAQDSVTQLKMANERRDTPSCWPRSPGLTECIAYPRPSCPTYISKDISPDYVLQYI